MFPHYQLPSEAWEYLKGLVGKRIRSVKSGVLDNTLHELYQRLGLESDVDFSEVTHAGPILITTEEDPGSTWVFQSDDLSQSLACRMLCAEYPTPNFFDELYREEQNLDDYLKVKFVLDLAPFCRSFIGKRIQSVKILKLPDDYWGAPKQGVYPNEVALVLNFADAGEVLIAFRMGGIHGNGHCLLTWDKLKSDYPVTDLVCPHEYSL